MKYYFIIITFVLHSFAVFAQKSKVDSLMTLLRSTKEDDKRTTYLNEISREFSHNNPDTAITISNQALVIAQKAGSKKGIAQSLGRLGAHYYFKAEYSRALDYYLEALKINEELKNKVGIATMLGNIGIVHDDIGERDKALEFYLKALKIDEELGNKNGMARHIGNIGRVYNSQKNYLKAEEYFFKFAEMAEELGNKEYYATAISNVGLAYYYQNKFTEALDYFFKAIKINQELENKTELGRNLGNIASVYTQIKNYKESFNYIFQALSISSSIGSLDEIKNHYEELSILYEKSNIPLQDTIGGKLLTMDQMRLRALHFHKRFIALRDTLWSAENKRNLLQKEMNFEFDKKAVAAKAEQDKKDAIAEFELKRKEQQRNYFIIGFVLVIILALYILRGYKQKQKANLLLGEKNKIIEEKNKDIMDSIHYAKRIQHSLLPTEKYIERILNDQDKNKSS